MKKLPILAIAALLLVLALPEQGLPQVSPLYSYYLPLVILPPVEPHQGVGSTYDIPFPGATWCYNWNVDPDCGCESVPMIWDETLIGAALGGDSAWVMGFNEPELSGQASVTPTLAAELWREIETLYPDRKLVAPAASKYWLIQFDWMYQTFYGGHPRLDALAVHCYGAWSAAQGTAGCTDKVDVYVDLAQFWGIPEVWVTEFGYLPCWPDGEEGVLAFMEGMVDYYRQNPTVTRWAWFQTSYYGTEPWSFGPHCNTSLIDIETGALTPFGVLYEELGSEGGISGLGKTN